MVSDPSDPFAALLAPPPHETPSERAQREALEAEARRVSDAIDDDIRRERIELRRVKRVKVLLLGQSESGKSTTLKNFRMKYTPHAWTAERMSWRCVIQLNLIHSMTVLLASSPISPVSPSSSTQSPSSALPWPRESGLLARLVELEQGLKRRLGASAEEVIEGGPLPADVLDTSASSSSTALSLDTSVTGKRRAPEFFVRSWKVLEGPHTRISTSTSSSARSHVEHDREDEVGKALGELAEEMKAVWAGVVAGGERRGLRDSAGFFLDDIDRIARPGYEPTDDDIVRARLRTVGVQEHLLRFEEGAEIGREWMMYDVGGTRTSRTAWLPFFEHVDAILFLAPISALDERLAEDRSVNRLEDSFVLWKAICSSKLLKKTTMIIFLNKCDILERKLRGGLRVRKYLPSYGERENEVGAVSRYLRHKFKDMLKQYSPEPRMCYAYATSVTDTKTTSNTLTSVRDGILRGYLKKADYL